MVDRLLRHPWLLPASVVLVLSLPCFRFGYLWDDYLFLERALAHRLIDLLPVPSDFFYRPLSRGLYFMFLSARGAPGPLLAHFLNAALLLLAVGLFTSFTARIAGRKVGMMAGLVFASLAPLPFLVGWASGVQDLLAMVFILAALHFRLSRRNGLALAATVGGLLSKETTIIAVPILVLFDRILGRKPSRIAPQLILYGVVIGAWAAIHPSIRVLLARGLSSGATGYVGMEHPATWPLTIARYAATLLNIPPPGLSTPWPEGRMLFLVVAAGIAIAGLWRVWGDLAAEGPVAPAGGRPVVTLGALLCVQPLFLTATMISFFTPYYAAIAGLGSSMLLGILLSRLPLRLAAAAIGILLVLGVWCRGLKIERTICTERNLGATSEALTRVEAGFHRLRESFPPESQILLSVQARGSAGVYTHMFQFQALRVWYRDPSLTARKPEARVPGNRPEFLFAITQGLDVIDIDPGSLRAVSSGAEPDYAFVEGAVRAYAVGLAGSGGTDQAVQILLHKPEISAPMQSVHRRMAAMFLLADGRGAEATEILSQSSPISREYALASLRAVLAEQPPGRIYDSVALQAFGVSEQDADGIRDLMRWSASMKYAAVSLRFAERLEALARGDAEAGATAARMRRLMEEKRRVPPPGDE